MDLPIHPPQPPFAFQKPNPDDAVPAKHFAVGPYRAESFGHCAGVMNANGVNCLTWTDGQTLTDLPTAQLIADRWNKKEIQ